LIEIFQTGIKAKKKNVYFSLQLLPSL